MKILSIVGVRPQFIKCAPLSRELRKEHLRSSIAGAGNVYLALGKTIVGRYLSVFYILKKNSEVLPISARSMDNKEWRKYVYE